MKPFVFKAEWEQMTNAVTAVRFDGVLEAHHGGLDHSLALNLVIDGLQLRADIDDGVCDPVRSTTAEDIPPATATAMTVGRTNETTPSTVVASLRLRWKRGRHPTVACLRAMGCYAGSCSTFQV